MDVPRVFTFWKGFMPPVIRLCLKTIQHNIPGAELWTVEKWKKVYDGSMGPWNRLIFRMPNVISDFIRYWLLSTYGGIWVDTDYIALRDIRPIWDSSADYIGYKENRTMPYTAIMGGSPTSPITNEQKSLARQMAGIHNTIGNAAGPRLTLQAMRNCPQAKITLIPRRLIHPIMWNGRTTKILEDKKPYPFPPEAYGVMLQRCIVNKLKTFSESQLLNHPSMIGQSFRKALSLELTKPSKP